MGRNLDDCGATLRLLPGAKQNDCSPHSDLDRLCNSRRTDPFRPLNTRVAGREIVAYEPQAAI
jgi:hypothetical protein